MKKEIALVGLWNAKNFGDPVLAYCTKKLLRRAIPCADGVKFTEISLIPEFQVSLVQRVKDFLWYRFAKLFGKDEVVGQQIYSRRLLNYFTHQLKTADAIVFVGGGVIKFRKIEPFDTAIEYVTEIALAKSIPVVMSSVGVEGYDEKNARCLKLKKSLKNLSLKYISTRDDLITLKNCYFDGKPSIPCVQVADPAVWASECFGVQKNRDSEIIGIGIARGSIFNDYDRNFTSENLMKFYVDLVKLILAKGLKVEMFTNGYGADNAFLDQILMCLPDGRVSKRIPNSAENLVQIIASYKGIVATRMHAGIIAYSLDVPAIGLVWNDKIRFFWERAGHPENSIDVTNLSPDKVVAALNIAMSNGYDQEYKRIFRQTIKDSSKNIASLLMDLN